MLTGCRNLFLTFSSLVNRKTWTCKSFKSKSDLHFSASAASFFPASVPSSPRHRTVNGSSSLHHRLSSTFQPPRRFRFTGPMELKETLQVLEQIAPLSLAESWDNVGLLIEPSRPRPVTTILLTNDLTDAVMAEAEALNCDLIISYHPPLFRPIKRLNQKDWKQRLAVRAVEAGIAVFSPHTSWDSVKGGVNDWLVAGLGSGQVSVLSQALGNASHCHRLEFMARSTEELNKVMEELKACDGETSLISAGSRADSTGIHASVLCSDSALTPSVQTLLQHSSSNQSLSILKLEKPPLPGHGQGRLSVLEQPVSVAEAVQKMKSHLGLGHLRLALGWGQTLESSVRTVAACAGSGASVLSGVKADLYITGRCPIMKCWTQQQREPASSSATTATASGFLAVFRERLAVRLPESVTVVVSKADRDPLVVV